MADYGHAENTWKTTGLTGVPEPSISAILENNALLLPIRIPDPYPVRFVVLTEAVW